MLAQVEALQIQSLPPSSPSLIAHPVVLNDAMLHADGSEQTWSPTVCDQFARFRLLQSVLFHAAQELYRLRAEEESDCQEA